MTYLPRPRYASLGAITDIASAAQSVVTDPCLGQVSAQLMHLHDLEQQPLIPGAPATPTAPVAGIGLCSAVTPLKVLTWVKENPWVAPLTGAAIVGGLIGIGYLWGKGRRR